MPEKLIDLRSDTVTKPSEKMRAAMANAVRLKFLDAPLSDAQLAELISDGGKISIGQPARGEDELVTRILAHVRVRTGHDFSSYKRSTVIRRIARRQGTTERSDTP